MRSALFDDHLLPLLRHGQRVDIWGGTHRDVHPTPSGYDELANIYETEAANSEELGSGGGAVRSGDVLLVVLLERRQQADKDDHGGVDYLPWWLNQINWMDQINGSRTLDVFDIHAYADANTTGLTTAQLQAASAQSIAIFGIRRM
jgi:hypothetical protein